MAKLSGNLNINNSFDRDDLLGKIKDLVSSDSSKKQSEDALKPIEKRTEEIASNIEDTAKAAKKTAKAVVDVSVALKDVNKELVETFKSLKTIGDYDLTKNLDLAGTRISKLTGDINLMQNALKGVGLTIEQLGDMDIPKSVEAISGFANMQRIKPVLDAIASINGAVASQSFSGADVFGNLEKAFSDQARIINEKSEDILNALGQRVKNKESYSYSSYVRLVSSISDIQRELSSSGHSEDDVHEILNSVFRTKQFKPKKEKVETPKVNKKQKNEELEKKFAKEIVDKYEAQLSTVIKKIADENISFDLKVEVDKKNFDDLLKLISLYQKAKNSLSEKIEDDNIIKFWNNATDYTSNGAKKLLKGDAEDFAKNAFRSYIKGEEVSEIVVPKIEKRVEVVEQPETKVVQKAQKKTSKRKASRPSVISGMEEMLEELRKSREYVEEAEKIVALYEAKKEIDGTRFHGYAENAFDAYLNGRIVKDEKTGKSRRIRTDRDLYKGLIYNNEYVSHQRSVGKSYKGYENVERYLDIIGESPDQLVERYNKEYSEEFLKSLEEKGYIFGTEFSKMVLADKKISDRMSLSNKSYSNSKSKVKDAYKDIIPSLLQDQKTITEIIDSMINGDGEHFYEDESLIPEDLMKNTLFDSNTLIEAMHNVARAYKQYGEEAVANPRFVQNLTDLRKEAIKSAVSLGDSISSELSVYTKRAEGFGAGILDKNQKTESDVIRTAYKNAKMKAKSSDLQLKSPVKKQESPVKMEGTSDVEKSLEKVGEVLDSVSEKAKETKKDIKDLFSFTKDYKVTKKDEERIRTEIFESLPSEEKQIISVLRELGSINERAKTALEKSGFSAQSSGKVYYDMSQTINKKAKVRETYGEDSEEYRNYKAKDYDATEFRDVLFGDIADYEYKKESLQTQITLLESLLAKLPDKEAVDNEIYNDAVKRINAEIEERKSEISKQNKKIEIINSGILDKTDEEKAKYVMDEISRVYSKLNTIDSSSPKTIEEFIALGEELLKIPEIIDNLSDVLKTIKKTSKPSKIYTLALDAISEAKYQYNLKGVHLQKKEDRFARENNLGDYKKNKEEKEANAKEVFDIIKEIESKKTEIEDLFSSIDISSSTEGLKDQLETIEKEKRELEALCESLKKIRSYVMLIDRESFKIEADKYRSNPELFEERRAELKEIEDRIRKNEEVPYGMTVKDPKTGEERKETIQEMMFRVSKQQAADERKKGNIVYPLPSNYFDIDGSTYQNTFNRKMKFADEAIEREGFLIYPDKKDSEENHGYGVKTITIADSGYPEITQRIIEANEYLPDFLNKLSELLGYEFNIKEFGSSIADMFGGIKSNIDVLTGYIADRNEEETNPDNTNRTPKTETKKEEIKSDTTEVNSENTELETQKADVVIKSLGSLKRMKPENLLKEPESKNKYLAMHHQIWNNSSLAQNKESEYYQEYERLEDIYEPRNRKIKEAKQEAAPTRSTVSYLSTYIDKEDIGEIEKFVEFLEFKKGDYASSYNSYKERYDKTEGNDLENKSANGYKKAIKDALAAGDKELAASLYSSLKIKFPKSKATLESFKDEDFSQNYETYLERSKKNVEDLYTKECELFLIYENFISNLKRRIRDINDRAEQLEEKRRRNFTVESKKEEIVNRYGAKTEDEKNDVVFDISKKITELREFLREIYNIKDGSIANTTDEEYRNQILEYGLDIDLQSSFQPMDVLKAFLKKAEDVKIEIEALTKASGEILGNSNIEENSLIEKSKVSLYRNPSEELFDILNFISKFDVDNKSSYESKLGSIIRYALGEKEDVVVNPRAKGMSEEDLSHIKEDESKLGGHLRYYDSFGIDTLIIDDIQVVISYYRERLKELLKKNLDKEELKDIFYNKESLMRVLGFVPENLGRTDSGSYMYSKDGEKIDPQSSLKEVVEYLDRNGLIFTNNTETPKAPTEEAPETPSSITTDKPIQVSGEQVNVETDGNVQKTEENDEHEETSIVEMEVETNISDKAKEVKINVDLATASVEELQKEIERLNSLSTQANKDDSPFKEYKDEIVENINTIKSKFKELNHVFLDLRNRHFAYTFSDNEYERSTKDANILFKNFINQFPTEGLTEEQKSVLSDRISKAYDFIQEEYNRRLNFENSHPGTALTGAGGWTQSKVDKHNQAWDRYMHSMSEFDDKFNKFIRNTVKMVDAAGKVAEETVDEEITEFEGGIKLIRDSKNNRIKWKFPDKTPKGTPENDAMRDNHFRFTPSDNGTWGRQWKIKDGSSPAETAVKKVIETLGLKEIVVNSPTTEVNTDKVELKSNEQPEEKKEIKPNRNPFELAIAKDAFNSRNAPYKQQAENAINGVFNSFKDSPKPKDFRLMRDNYENVGKNQWQYREEFALEFIYYYEKAITNGKKMAKDLSDFYDKIKPLQEQFKANLTAALNYTPSEKLQNYKNTLNKIDGISDYSSLSKEELEQLKQEVLDAEKDLIESPEYEHAKKTVAFRGISDSTHGRFVDFIDEEIRKRNLLETETDSEKTEGTPASEESSSTQKNGVGTESQAQNVLNENSNVANENSNVGEANVNIGNANVAESSDSSESNEIGTQTQNIENENSSVENADIDIGEADISVPTMLNSEPVSGETEEEQLQNLISEEIPAQKIEITLDAINKAKDIEKYFVEEGKHLNSEVFSSLTREVQQMMNGMEIEDFPNNIFRIISQDASVCSDVVDETWKKFKDVIRDRENGLVLSASQQENIGKEQLDYYNRTFFKGSLKKSKKARGLDFNAWVDLIKDQTGIDFRGIISGLDSNKYSDSEEGIFEKIIAYVDQGFKREQTLRYESISRMIDGEALRDIINPIDTTTIEGILEFTKRKSKEDIISLIEKIDNGYSFGDNGAKFLKGISDVISNQRSDLSAEDKEEIAIRFNEVLKRRRSKNEEYLNSKTDEDLISMYEEPQGVNMGVRKQIAKTLSQRGYIQDNGNFIKIDISDNINKKIEQILKGYEGIEKGRSRKGQVSSIVNHIKHAILNISEIDNQTELANALFDLSKVKNKFVPEYTPEDVILGVKDLIPILEPIVEKLGIEIRDRTGEIFDVEDFFVKVINHEGSPENDNPVIKKMVKPILFKNGKNIQYGQIITDDPKQEKDAIDEFYDELSSSAHSGEFLSDILDGNDNVNVGITQKILELDDIMSMTNEEVVKYFDNLEDAILKETIGKNFSKNISDLEMVRDRTATNLKKAIEYNLVDDSEGMLQPIVDIYVSASDVLFTAFEGQQSGTTLADSFTTGVQSNLDNVMNVVRELTEEEINSYYSSLQSALRQLKLTGGDTSSITSEMQRIYDSKAKGNPIMSSSVIRDNKLYQSDEVYYSKLQAEYNRRASANASFLGSDFANKMWSEMERVSNRLKRTETFETLDAISSRNDKTSGTVSRKFYSGRTFTDKELEQEIDNYMAWISNYSEKEMNGTITALERSTKSLYEQHLEELQSIYRNGEYEKALPEMAATFIGQQTKMTGKEVAKSLKREGVEERFATRERTSEDNDLSVNEAVDKIEERMSNDNNYGRLIKQKQLKALEAYVMGQDLFGNPIYGYKGQYSFLRDIGNGQTASYRMRYVGESNNPTLSDGKWEEIPNSRVITTNYQQVEKDIISLSKDIIKNENALSEAKKQFGSSYTDANLSGLIEKDKQKRTNYLNALQLYAESDEYEYNNDYYEQFKRDLAEEEARQRALLSSKSAVSEARGTEKTKSSVSGWINQLNKLKNKYETSDYIKSGTSDFSKLETSYNDILRFLNSLNGTNASQTQLTEAKSKISSFDTLVSRKIFDNKVTQSNLSGSNIKVGTIQKLFDLDTFINDCEKAGTAADSLKQRATDLRKTFKLTEEPTEDLGYNLQFLDKNGKLILDSDTSAKKGRFSTLKDFLNVGKSELRSITANSDDITSLYDNMLDSQLEVFKYQMKENIDPNISKNLEDVYTSKQKLYSDAIKSYNAKNTTSFDTKILKESNELFIENIKNNFIKNYSDFISGFTKQFGDSTLKTKISTQFSELISGTDGFEKAYENFTNSGDFDAFLNNFKNISTKWNDYKKNITEEAKNLNANDIFSSRMKKLNSFISNMKDNAGSLEVKKDAEELFNQYLYNGVWNRIKTDSSGNKTAATITELDVNDFDEKFNSLVSRYEGINNSQQGNKTDEIISNYQHMMDSLNEIIDYAIKTSGNFDSVILEKLERKASEYTGAYKKSVKEYNDDTNIPGIFNTTNNEILGKIDNDFVNNVQDLLYKDYDKFLNSFSKDFKNSSNLSGFKSDISDTFSKIIGGSDILDPATGLVIGHNNGFNDYLNSFLSTGDVNAFSSNLGSLVLAWDNFKNGFIDQAKNLDAQNLFGKNIKNIYSFIDKLKASNIDTSSFKSELEGIINSYSYDKTNLKWMFSDSTGKREATYSDLQDLISRFSSVRNNFMAIDSSNIGMETRKVVDAYQAVLDKIKEIDNYKITGGNDLNILDNLNKSLDLAKDKYKDSLLAYNAKTGNPFETSLLDSFNGDFIETEKNKLLANYSKFMLDFSKAFKNNPDLETVKTNIQNVFKDSIISETSGSNGFGDIANQFKNGSLTLDQFKVKLEDIYNRWNTLKTQVIDRTDKNLSFKDVFDQLNKMNSVSFLSDKTPEFAAKIAQIRNEFLNLINDWNKHPVSDNIAKLAAISSQLENLKNNAKEYRSVTKDGQVVSIPNGAINSWTDLETLVQNYLATMRNVKIVQDGTFGNGNKKAIASWVNPTTGKKMSSTFSYEDATGYLRKTTDVQESSKGFLGAYLGGLDDISKAFMRSFSGYRLIGMVNRAFQSGISYLKQYDTALTKISYTMNLTQAQLSDLGRSAIDMAEDLSISIDNALSAYQIYANMKTSTEDIQTTAEPTLILSNLAGMDSSTAADDIQAVINQFELSAEDAMHVADVYDYVSSQIAVDYSKGISGIAEAAQNVGNVANEAGKQTLPEYMVTYIKEYI